MSRPESSEPVTNRAQPIDEMRGPFLVIVAHPDDIEAHCAGTVARLVERGDDVQFVLATSGNRGTDIQGVTEEQIAEIREGEQLAAAGILGVERVQFLRYDDSDLLFQMPRLRADLTAIIRREQPQTIITHDPYPGNGSRDSCSIYPDHTTLGLLVFQAAYLCSPGPLFYPEQLEQGLSPHRVAALYLIMSDTPDTFVDIGPVWERRMTALSQHHSQGRDDPEMEQFFIRIAGALGKRAGCQLAEGFRHLAPT